MASRLFQLISECIIWNARLLHIVGDTSLSPHNRLKPSSALILLSSDRYFHWVAASLETIDHSPASPTPIDLDALLNFLSRCPPNIDDLLSDVGMFLDDRLRPSTLRKTIECVLIDDVPDAPTFPSTLSDDRVKWVDSVLKDIEDLRELQITRNNPKIIEYLRADPDKVTTQAFELNPKRVLEILNRIGSRNRERAYEIVGIYEGHVGGIVAKTYRRVTRARSLEPRNK